MAALNTLSTNTQTTADPSEQHQEASAGSENQPQELQHKSVLAQKGSAENDRAQNGTYISPSDAILSPATQKLAGFKQRQIGKQSNGKNTTSRMLFGRTPSMTSASGGFEGMDDKVAK